MLYSREVDVEGIVTHPREHEVYPLPLPLLSISLQHSAPFTVLKSWVVVVVVMVVEMVVRTSITDTTSYLNELGR